MALSAPSGALAQTAPLSAQGSDPNVMGWMQGFPPPKDKMITQPVSVYFSFPRLRWSVCHLREFLPTEETSRAGGDPSKFRGFPTIPNGSYTSQFWVFHNDHGAFAARGVHGQTSYVDPTAEMVLVRPASDPRAQNGFIDPTSLPAYQAVAEFLMAR